MPELYYPFQGHVDDIQQKVVHLRDRARALVQAAGVAEEDSILRLAQIYESFAACMDLLSRQLPYKAGDRVRLTRAPKCEGDWKHSEHFLVVGAAASVKSVSVDYLMRSWKLYLEFDDESTIAAFDYDSIRTGYGQSHKKGDVVSTPKGSRHVYGFGPDFVEKIPDEEKKIDLSDDGGTPAIVRSNPHTAQLFLGGPLGETQPKDQHPKCVLVFRWEEDRQSYHAKTYIPANPEPGK